MTAIDRAVIQSISLIISFVAIIALLFYWRKGHIATFYVLPPLAVYLLSFSFYVYVLTNKGNSSTIATAISSYLRFIELAVGLGILIAIGEKERNKKNKEKRSP